MTNSGQWQQACECTWQTLLKLRRYLTIITLFSSLFCNKLTRLSIQNLLVKQFLNSPFCKTNLPAATTPTTLDIFDFDSTLFLSPLLSSNLWHSSFINAITTENLMGPGWWRDIRTLEFDQPFDTLQHSSWQGYWNEDVVKAVQMSCQNPSHLTILLTGRRYHPFHNLIENMLLSKGLQFDILGLRPDPEQAEQDAYINVQPNVFDTTMDFKTSFIVNLLSSVPTLQDIVMWDDRNSHISAFQTYLSAMVSNNLIKTGKLICVKPLRPQYNPQWEVRTVQNMISTHNEAVVNKKQQLGGQVVTIENYGGQQDLISSTHQFELKKVPCIPVLKLEDEDILHLKSVFEPLFWSLSFVDVPIEDWEEKYAEQPLFFGDQVLLVGDEQQQQKKEYAFKLLATSKPKTRDEGLMLQVQDIETKKVYMLPLWYKPSDFIKLLKKEYQWIPLPQDDDKVYHSVFGYHYLYIVTSIEE